jgi:glycine cleavage system transcriptional repressor
MPLLAVTVVGHDRPGIVAEVTAAIAELGGNLEDSSMSLLRGHFAMTLVAAVPADPADLQQRLAPLTADGLAVSVLSVPAEAATEPGVLAQLSVHGADRPGIVSTATQVVAQHGGNIVDLATRLGSSLYVLVAEVDFPAGTDLMAVNADLTTAMEPLGVRAGVRAADEDVL